MSRQHHPADYNAFGYDPRGAVANMAGLMFGPEWRPENAPQHPDGAVAPPRFGPPAAYQQAVLPHNFAPNYPQMGYYGGMPPPPPPGLWQPYAAAAAVPWAMANQPPQPPPTPSVNGSRAAATPQRTLGSQEVREGVYRLTATMSTGAVQKQFTFESDIPYEDFRSRVCANLDISPEVAQLGYRISGLEGPKKLPCSLSSSDDFKAALERVIPVIQRARTKQYGLEMVNLTPPAEKPVSKTSSSKKRSRDEDIPIDPTEKVHTDALKVLEAHLKCEACKGHCYINRAGTHQRLDYQQMSYWAKMMVTPKPEDRADVYNPPSCITLDHRPKRVRTQPPPVAAPALHFHLDNITFGGNVLGNRPSTSEATPTLPQSPPASATAHPILYSLQDLHQQLPDYDLVSLYDALVDIGVYCLDDIGKYTNSELILWTGATPSQVELLRTLKQATAKPTDTVQNVPDVVVINDDAFPAESDDDDECDEDADADDVDELEEEEAGDV